MTSAEENMELREGLKRRGSNKEGMSRKQMVNELSSYLDIAFEPSLAEKIDTDAGNQCIFLPNFTLNATPSNNSRRRQKGKQDNV